MYIHLSLQEEIVHNNFLMGVKFETSWGVDPGFFKITMLRWLFSLWSEKKWWVFGPLNLFNLRYIKEGVGGNNNIGIKKCTTIFLWVLNLGQVGGRRKIFQNHTATMIFSKMVSNFKNFSRSKRVTLNFFGTKFQVVFFSEKIFKGFLL